MLVGIFLGIYLYQPSPSQVEEAPIDSIAVLPFASSSEDEDSASLADGIPASISSSLMRIERLKVKPPAVLIRYKGKAIDPQTVAEEQNVSAVLMGNVAKRGNSLGVEVYLIDGRDNTQIWSQPYSRPTSEIFTLQEDIARQVAEALRLRLIPEESKGLVQSGTQNLEAYQAFLKGEYHSGSAQEKIRYFEQAIELDPSYQMAYGRLAGWHFQIARIKTSEEDYAIARTYGEKLIEIDPSTARAHWMKAFILWSYDRKWKEAAEEYARAKEVEPYSESDTSNNLMMFLEWMGRREEYLAATEENLKQSDPFSAFQQAALAYQFLHHGEYSRAIEQGKKYLELAPTSVDAFYVLSESYRQMGMEREAREAMFNAQKYWGRSEDELAAMRKALDESGMKGVWRMRLEDVLKQPSPRPINVASLYAMIGEKDKAFEWLEKTWSYPLMGYEVAPSSQNHNPLRSDPRFAELLRKLNLPEEAIQRHLTLPGG